METDALTTEVVEAVGPAPGSEALESTVIAEKALTAERCASNLGAVAIVCVGCPMLELCRFKNEAAQDQQVAFEVTNDLSLPKDIMGLTYVGGSIEAATAAVSVPEAAGITRSQLDIVPALKRPSYREQLFDDKINFVLAESLLAPDEVASPVVDYGPHNTIVSPTTNQVASSEVIIEVGHKAIIPVAVSPSSDQEASSQVEVKAAMVAPVDASPAAVVTETIPTVHPSQPERFDADIRPSKEVKTPRVVSARREVIVAAAPDETAVVKTTYTEVALAPLVTEKVVIRPEAAVFITDTLSAPVAVKPLIIEATTEVIALDVAPVSDELEVMMSRDNDPLIEYIQIINSSDSGVETRRFDQAVEKEVATLRAIIATPLIDSDSIDLEIRLSDTVSVQQQAIAVLRQLALRALQAVALKLYLGPSV